MYEVEDHYNNYESARESNSQMSNIFDYIKNEKINPLDTETSRERAMEINDENDIYSVEKEICGTRLDNIHEEEIVVEKRVEYFVPTNIHYKFAEICGTPEGNEFSVKKSDLERTVLTPNIAFSRSFNNKSGTDGLFLEANVSGKSLRPVKSKSLTYLDYSAPKRVKYETMPQNQEKDPVEKYSKGFLNDERTLQELKQQNMLAQDLLKKYFKDDESPTRIDDKARRNKTANKKCPTERKLETVSSLMKRYFSRMDENEQVCIKPSDEYVFLNTEGASKGSSVKFVRPFKYHKKFWDSGSNLETISKTESPFKLERPGRKRSRLEFESNMALKQDSSTDASLKTQNVQFLRTGDKNKRLSDSETNKILYKTDSKNFENSYSLEELHTFMPERYETLRNLYGCNNVENVSEQNRVEQSKPRYNFQTLPNRNSKSRELVVKFFDSGSHIKVTDEDYKKWLKEKNFLKYTDFAKSSVSSITFKSISQKIVNYSIAPFSKLNREKKRSRPSIMNKSHQTGFSKFANTATIPSFTNTTGNCKFADMEYNNLYQLVICEHIVISNFINFCCSFNATRIKKLTVMDRVYQLMFLVFCYYVLSFMNNNIFNPFDENWF